MVGTLNDDWSQFLIVVSDISLLALRLQDVGDSSNSFNVTLRLLLVDEVSSHLTLDVLLLLLHDVAGVLFEDLLLNQSRLVGIVLHRQIVEVNEGHALVPDVLLKGVDDGLPQDCNGLYFH